MTKLYLILILSLFTFSINALAQQDKGLFIKKYGLKSGVAINSEDVIVDNQQNVLVANAFGVDHFDGVRWKRYRISKDYTRIPRYIILVKNIYETNSYILGGSAKCGILKKQRGTFTMKAIVSTQETKEVLGGYLYKVIQNNQKTYFLGRYTGVIIYDHLTKEKIKVSKVKINSRPSYHLYAGRIILNDQSGETFILSDNIWKKTAKYSFIKKFSPQCILKTDHQNTFLVAKSGEAYLWKNQNTFIQLKTISEKFRGGFFTRLKQQNGKLYICSNDKLLVFDINTNKVIYYKHFKNIFF